MQIGKPQKSSIAIAYNMARKAGKKMSHGGKCYACGGQVNPELKESHLAKGGIAESDKEDDLTSSPDELMDYGGGGGVDKADLEEMREGDDNEEDLVYSPEEYGETGFGEADNEKEGSSENEGKRNNFLKAYFIHKRLRRG